MGEIVEFRRHRRLSNYRYADALDVTPVLMLARSAIIFYVTLSVMPFEFAFDLIEGELKRRGGCVINLPISVAAKSRSDLRDSGFTACRVYEQALRLILEMMPDSPAAAIAKATLGAEEAR